MARYSREDLGYQFGVAWVSGVSGGGGGGGREKAKRENSNPSPLWPVIKICSSVKAKAGPDTKASLESVTEC